MKYALLVAGHTPDTVRQVMPGQALPLWGSNKNSSNCAMAFMPCVIAKMEDGESASGVSSPIAGGGYRLEFEESDEEEDVGTGSPYKVAWIGGRLYGECIGMDNFRPFEPSEVELGTLDKLVFREELQLLIPDAILVSSAHGESETWVNVHLPTGRPQLMRSVGDLVHAESDDIEVSLRYQVRPSKWLEFLAMRWEWLAIPERPHCVWVGTPVLEMEEEPAMGTFSPEFKLPSLG